MNAATRSRSFNLRVCGAVLTAAIWYLHVRVATAASDVWDGNGGSPPSGVWGADGNWVDDTTPGNGDTATFNVANTYNVAFDADPASIQALFASAGNVTFASSGGAQTLAVNSGGGQDATVNGGATLSLGTSGNPLHLTVGDDLIVNGNGTLNVNFGSQVNTTDLIAQASSGNATIVVDGTGSALNRTGTGQRAFGNSNGTVSLTYRNNSTGDHSDTLVVGNISSDVTGTANLNVESDADLTLDSLTLGIGTIAGPTGAMTVTGAGSTITQSGASALTIGRASGNTGILNVYSSGVFTTGTGAIALNTTGRINVSGGALHANGNMTMASGGILSIGSGGILNANAALSMASGSTLSLGTGGTLNTNGALSMASGSNLSIGSGGILNANAALTMASGSTFNLNNGALNLNAGFNIGAGAAFNNNGGLMSVGSGAVVATAGPFTVGSASGAEMRITAGGQVSNTHGRIAQEFGATGVVTVSGPGSQWLNSSDLAVGGSDGGVGSLTIENEGTVYVQNNLIINSISSVTLNGGTLRFNQASGLDRLNFYKGTIRLGRDVTFSNDYVIDALFDYRTSISFERTLQIDGNAVVDRDLELFGGKLVASQIMWIDDVGEYFFGEGLRINSGGDLVTNFVNFSGSANSTNDVVVTGEGSSWTSHDLDIGNTPGSNIVSHDTLWIRDGGLADIDYLTLWPNANLVLDGGTLRLGVYYPYGGVATFLSGTLALEGGHYITDGSSEIRDFFGSVPTISLRKNLTIEGEASLYKEVAVDGGILTVGKLSGAHFLDLRGGTLDITNQAVTIGAGGTFTSLDVRENMTVNSMLGITNQGLVTGDGQIGGAFHNAAGGELRAQAGRSLALTGAGNTNTGQIKLFGGELDFTQDLTNNAGAFISGNGSLITGGLTNNGTMNFAGTANIVGDVINSATGKIISGGGGATIFFNDVTNNGEIRTSTNGFTVFFGAVDGAGAFTGTGTVNFEGDLSPGNSPAVVQFAGDVVLGPEATLQIELGGDLPGQYDQIQVGGELTLDGALELSLIDGFIPSPGQTFDILNAGSVAGAFSSVQLPSLAGFQWNVSQLSAGVLSLAPAFTADFDEDGDVDANDLGQWQGDFGVNALSDADNDGDSDGADFLAWQRQLGSPLGISPSFNSVPEPATWTQLLFAAAGSTLGWRRQIRARLVP